MSLKPYHASVRRMLLADDIQESSDELLFLISQHEDFYINRMLRCLYLIKTDQIESYAQLAEAIGLSSSKSGYLAVNRWLKTYKEGGLDELLSHSKCKNIHSLKGRGKIPYWLMEKLAWELRNRNVFPEFDEIKDWIESVLGFEVDANKLTHTIFEYIKPKWRSYKVFLPPEHEPLHLAIKASTYNQFNQWRHEQGLSLTEAINKVFESYPELSVESQEQPDISQDPPVEFYIDGVPPVLRTNLLAERLGVTVTTVSSKREHRKFLLWSSLKDPDGVGWKWNAQIRRFEAVFFEQKNSPET